MNTVTNGLKNGMCPKISGITSLITGKLFVGMFIGFLFFSVFQACEKNPDFQNYGKGVEIYLLQDYQEELGTDNIIESTVKLDSVPLVNYSQIISYNSNDHTFKISKSSIDTINKDGGLRYHFKAFAVTIDKEIIYTGFLWPAYASSIKKCIVMDPVLYSGSNKLRVLLAYPTNSFTGNYPDLRNDPRIIGVLHRDGKIEN